MSWSISPYSAPSKEQSLVIIEFVLLEFYTVLLRLYPRQFRQDFAAEMHTVFGDALGCARREGLWAMLRLSGREARELPYALAREHWQSVREKEEDMEKSNHPMAGTGDPSPVFGETPARSWGEIVMAILPFLLLLLVDVGPMLLVQSGLLTWEANGMKVVSIALGVFMVGAILVSFFLAWRKKWPVWSATWYLFFVYVPLILASMLLSLLIHERSNHVLNEGLVVYIVLPLILAVLLYSVTRRNPLRGLLAALPVIYLLWMISNMEFVPDSIKVAIKISSIALICMTVAFLLRRGNWRLGLYAVLATNLVVGILFSYAGIYHGGTLPGSAIGPNWVEVARSLIPQYLATSAILLGPLFAWKMRQAGRSAGQTGRIGYHLALAGLLLVILANLVGLMMGMDSRYGRIDSTSRSLLMAGIVLGLGAYLLGICLSLGLSFFLLQREPLLARNPPKWAPPEWAPRLLLALLPLAIPLTFLLPFITSTWPIHDLYGNRQLWEMPHTLSLSIGMVWLALSVWVVTQGAEHARPAAAVGEASAAPPLV